MFDKGASTAKNSGERYSALLLHFQVEIAIVIFGVLNFEVAFIIWIQIRGTFFMFVGR